jgi:hypothetical protein
MKTSFQMRLDLLDVTTGLRPVARITARKEVEAALIARELLRLNLCLAAGRVTRLHPSRPKNGYVDEFQQNLSGAEEFINLYVSARPETCEDARDLDERGDDLRFGRLLGYPRCCVDWMMERGHVPSLVDCFKLYAEERRYSVLNWPAAMALDAALIPHYACSQSCGATKDLAIARWQLICRFGNERIRERVQRAHSCMYGLKRDGLIDAPVVERPSNYIALAEPVDVLP